MFECGCMFTLCIHAVTAMPRCSIRLRQGAELAQDLSGDGFIRLTSIWIHDLTVWHMGSVAAIAGPPRQLKKTKTKNASCSHRAAAGVPLCRAKARVVPGQPTQVDIDSRSCHTLISFIALCYVHAVTALPRSSGMMRLGAGLAQVLPGAFTRLTSIRIHDHVD